MVTIILRMSVDTTWIMMVLASSQSSSNAALSVDVAPAAGMTPSMTMPASLRLLKMCFMVAAHMV